MCNCREKFIQQLKNEHPKSKDEYYYKTHEGRTFDTVIASDGRNKTKIILLHAYCPSCGKPFDESESE